MKHHRLPPLGSLRAFDAIVRQGSFKQAAETIGVSPTAISHQIRVLETALNQAVFERSAREVKLTAAGELLSQATGGAFTALQQAVDAVHQLQLPPALTLTTTSNFLTHWLLPRLQDLKSSCPQIDLRLHTTLELVDLAQPGVDVAIRYSQSVDLLLHSVELYRDSFVLVASPTLRLRQLADLQHCTLFHVQNRLVPQPAPDWHQWRDRFGPPALDLASGLHFTDETYAIQAAIAGQGVAIVSRLLAKDFIDKQILCTPFSGHLPGANYYLVCTQRNARREEIQQFSAWLTSRMPTGQDTALPAKPAPTPG